MVLVELTDSGDAGVTVKVRWDRNIDQSDKPPMLTSPLETVNLVCSSPAMKKGKRISPQGLAGSCRWKSKVATHGVVIIHTSKGSFPATASRTYRSVGSLTLALSRVERQRTSQRPRCTASIRTRDQHDQRCGADFCSDPFAWRLDAETPSGILHSPRLECTADNLGSCEWNALDRTNRFSSRTANNEKTLIVERRIGSRDISVRMCATEDVYGDVPVSQDAKTVQLTENFMFVVDVPSGSTGVLRVTWASGSGEEVVQAGAANARLALVDKTVTPASSIYTYRVSAAK